MEKVNIPEPIPRHPAVRWSRFKARWPLLVWLLAIGGAVFFYFHGGQFGGMTGFVDTTREEVGPLETARLKALSVTIGQRVAAGDVLAAMDTTLLDTQMAVEKLQIDRQFAAAVSRAEAALRDARVRQAEAAGELEVLSGEIERMDQLLAKQLIDAQMVSRLRARHGALSQALQFYPEMIRGLEDDLDRARRRMETMEAELVTGTAAPATNMAGQADLDLEESKQRLGLLDLRRQSYVLRAGANGIVSRIDHQPGDVVQAGIPILSLVVDGVQRFVGFLPEYSAHEVTEGMEAYVSRTAGGPIVRARVLAAIPEILNLPNRVNPFPAMPVHGRRVVLAPEEPNDLLPGEGVSIYFRRPWLSMFLDRLRGGKTAPAGGQK